MHMYRPISSTRRLLGVLILALALLGPASSALGAGDDYPAAYRNGDPASDADRWGYTVRTQPSFVAWRLEQAGIRGTANQAWGLIVQSSLSVEDLRDLAGSLGGRVDTTPEAGSIALSPGSASGTSFTAWVSAVNGDGSVATENYSTANGYYVIPMTSAPWYVHLPSGARTPADPTDPDAGAGSRTSALRGLTLGRRSLTARITAVSAGRVRFTVTGKGRRITVGRTVAAGRRLVVVRIPRRLAAGRYRVKVALPGPGPVRTRAVRVR